METTTSTTKSDIIPALRKLLGVTTLIEGNKKNRSEVTVSSLEGKPLLLLFSGEWCPSCRQFKPRLVSFYKKMKEAKKEFEVVYITQDRSEEEFETAFDTMPWLALPLKEKRSHTRLASMCQIEGVPKLVLVNTKGKIVTTEARKLMSKDPEGEEFPWVPPTVFETLKDVKCFTHEGRLVKLDDLKKKEAGFAIYFAASWIRPCRFFTPKLVTTYMKMKEAGVDMEIVLAPVEQEQEGFEDHWAEMPFPTIPPSHPSVKKLRETLGINNVPTLVTINSDSGEVINMEAASVMEDDPEGVRFPWKPKELPPVSRFYPSQDVVSAVHENICVVLYLNGATNKVSAMQEFARSAVLWDAQKNAEMENVGDKIRFFTVDEHEAEKSFLLSVMKSLRLKPPLHGQPALVLFCLLNHDRQLIPAPSMDAGEVSKKVEAFRLRQQEDMGDNNNNSESEKKEGDNNNNTASAATASSS